MFALFSPVFGMANWITARRNGRKTFKRDLAVYRVRKAAKEKAIEADVRRERVLRLGVAILTDPDREADWEWLRWLPHLRSPYGPGLLIGNNPETVA